MALSTDQLIEARRAVGDKPNDAALDAIYARTGDLGELILEVLETRLANLKAAPDSFSIPGEYSQSTAGQIKALEADVATRRAEAGLAGSVVVILDPPPLRVR